MKQIHIYSLLLAIGVTGFLYGCNESGRTPIESPTQGEKIELSSSSPAYIGAGSRAATNFPNSGNIGVVAATELENPLGDTDWSLYSDINNAEAVAGSMDVGVGGNPDRYHFAWQTQKYWPFDGSSLYFMAYSPRAAGNDNNYILSTQNNSLYIAMQPNMPDIMYASNNTGPQPYSKNKPEVDLGEFRHALSQLTINVIAGDNLPDNIKVSNLTVRTLATTASLVLPLGDEGLVVSTLDEGPPFENVLVGGITDFQNDIITRKMMIFPGVEDYTGVGITLLDTNNGQAFEARYMMSFFENVNSAGEPVRLERAKNTTLEIWVNITDVENPNETLELKGKITPWIDGGDFGIIIE